MSQRQSGYARVANDLYQTPDWVVGALADHLAIDGRYVWEPAAGEGQMVRALEARGATVMATDIKDYGIGRKFLCEWDFVQELACPFIAGFDLLISNPPYGKGNRLAEVFIARGLGYIERRGAMAMLLPVDFNSGKTRAKFFRDCPQFAAKITLTRRIVWFEPAHGQKKTGPSGNHAWFVWGSELVAQRIGARQLYAPMPAQVAA